MSDDVDAMHLHFSRELRLTNLMPCTVSSEQQLEAEIGQITLRTYP